jgi:hypothetical protein
MSGYQQPLPPSVYRRRRLAVFGGLLALVVVIVLIIVRPGFGETAQPGGDEAEMEEEVAAPPPPCTASQISLTAQTDASRYNPGDFPQLWLKVENVGFADCELEVGALAQEYLITSGTDRVWSSKDCQEGGEMSKIVLKPGETRETSSIVWDRTRSSETTCDDARPIMPGGGATYHLRVFLGEFQSEETRRFILN